MCHKTQKFPAFEAGDKLFQGYFAWCSSIGSHVGQQADATLEHSLLNCNPEYVPYRIAIIRSNPAIL